MENKLIYPSQVVITLGGKGTRLLEVTKHIPKPLWPINGIHTLERTTKVLSDQGIKNFIWILNYKRDLFEAEYFKLTNKYNINIVLYQEKQEIGEAGSLLHILDKLNETFLFINGDIVFDIDVKRLFDFHIRNSADISFITHLTNHPNDSDCISENSSFGISEYKLKSEKIFNNKFYLGNAGVAVLKRDIVSFIKKKNIDKVNKFSLFKDFILCAHQNGFKVFSYNSSEYLKDMGTPERLEIIKNDLNSKMVYKRSYRKRQKVLFLDRDNTLIYCPKNKYITDEKFTIFKTRIAKIKEISEKYDFVLIISNQPQISMGLINYQDVLDINAKLILDCQKIGLNISAAYICPHHPHNGFKDEVKDLKTSCFCRKPLPGLILEAAYNRNISLKDSLLIGDSWRDKTAASLSNTDFLHVAELDSSS